MYCIWKRATDPVVQAHFEPSHVSLVPPEVSGRKVTRDGVLHWSPLATQISSPTSLIRMPVCISIKCLSVSPGATSTKWEDWIESQVRP